MRTGDAKRWVEVVVAALLLACLSACRCDRETPSAAARDGADDTQEVDAAGLRLMPRGMLGAPSDASNTVPSGAAGTAPFRLTAAAPSGASVEVNSAPSEAGAPSPGGPGARYFGFGALPLLHDAFAEARPGFALLTPQRFEGAELRALRTRLAEAGARRDVAAPLAADLRDRADEAARSGHALYFYPPK